MDIEIPETSSHGRFEQTVTVLIGMATVVAALLVNLDLAAHRHQARASAEATRLAVAAFRTMTTGSLDLGAKTTAMTRVVDLVFTARERAIAAKPDPQLSFLADAERVAGERSAAAYMHTVGFRGSVPQLLDTPGSLGEQLREAVADRTSRFNDGVASSNLQVDRADRYGRRASRTTLALAFLASAGALFGLAGVLRAGRAGWLSLATGMLGLLAAGALGIIAFVT